MDKIHYFVPVKPRAIKNLQFTLDMHGNVHCSELWNLIMNANKFIGKFTVDYMYVVFAGNFVENLK